MENIKIVLRKQIFPKGVIDALQIIEQLIKTQGSTSMYPGRDLGVMHELISEFVFCEYKYGLDNRQKSFHEPLTGIKELQLLEILCNYFSSNTSTEGIRSTVFHDLFPPNDPSRFNKLVKLVSMAISTGSRSVLDFTGYWLHQSGPTGKGSLALAQGLVSDYFYLVPDAKDRLRNLPNVAPQFTACFLAAVAELFSGADVLPPPALLSMVNAWLSKQPKLCTASIMPPSLQMGAMVPTTPAAGLFRWCILSPLRSTDAEEEYSLLQLTVMESVADNSNAGDPLLTTQQLSTVLPPILSLAPQADVKNIQLSLDRLGQALLVLLQSGSIAGNIHELLNQFDVLPENRLLSIVKARFR